jgi:hypothetical protein
MLLGDGERWLAVLAFVDEAETNDKCPCVTVAGFYGDRDQWKLFRDIWKPQSKGFHALRCSSQFPALSDAIEASHIQGIFATLWKANYRELATEHMKSFMGNPYAICAFLCAMQICQEVGAPTSFVFEQGQPNFEFVKRVLDAMMDSGEYCISSVTGAKKVDFIELHPADFVSHCASIYDKPPLQRLFDAGVLKHGHITEQMLRDVAPQVTRIVNMAKNQRLKAKKNR